MKRKRIAGSENPATLTRNSVKETGCPQAKSNRLKKQAKLIQMNSRFNFRMGSDGCVYYLKGGTDE